MTMRLTTIEEIAAWIDSMREDNAQRIELWIKPRGATQRSVLQERGDALDIADAFFAHVQQDPRAQQGLATYAILAFRGEEQHAVARAFVMPARGADHALAPHAPTGDLATSSYALSTVLAGAQAMNAGAFASLQRENEHQRKINEAMVRATAGHFESTARGYERAIELLQKRLDDALAELAQVRDSSDKYQQAAEILEKSLAEEQAKNVKAVVEGKRELMRDDWTFKTLTMFAPMVGAGIMGKPMTESPFAAEGLKGFVASLKPPQIHAIGQCLDDGQRGFFFMLLREIQTKIEAEAKAAKDANAASNGADASAPANANQGA